MHLTAACALLITEKGEPMAALLKTTAADPTVPAALRADHLSGFDKPARPRRTRPAPAAAQAEVETLLGDPRKAREKLGWTPTTTFEELVREMVEEDYRLARRDSLVKLAGFKAFDYHE